MEARAARIVWLDSMGATTGWTNKTKIKSGYLNTIAYIIDETDEALFISHTISPKVGLHYDIFMIPKGAIKEYEEIEL